MRITQFFRSFYFLIFVSVSLIVLAACLYCIFYRSKILIVDVPVIEPELGPTKVRYLFIEKPQQLERTGKEIYASLKVMQGLDNKVNIINIEKPISPLLKPLKGGKTPKEQDLVALNSSKGWSMTFIEGSLKEEHNCKKQKFYRIRVATVKSPEKANEIWDIIKSKNPIVFENCKFIIDKKSLSDGSIVYNIALGEYKNREDTYAMVSRLNSIGQNAYVYEILK
jgi:hypothetical protein